MKSMIGGVVLVTLVSPALANEYWVEYNYSTHVCSIVEKKSPDTSADTAQGSAAAGTTSATAPNGTPGAPQGANAANTTEGPASGFAPVIVVPGPNNQTGSDATQGANAANTTTEGAASGAPNGANTSDATQGANAANTTTEVATSSAPNAPTASGANAATKGAASAAPDAPTAWNVPTDAGAGDNNADPFKALADSWARKKAAAEAAGTDTTHALIGIAMHSREEAEAEMQIMRKCGLKP